jgi:hypothetical protein
LTAPREFYTTHHSYSSQFLKAFLSSGYLTDKSKNQTSKKGSKLQNKIKNPQNTPGKRQN